MDSNNNRIMEGDVHFYNDHPSEEHFRRNLSGIYFLMNFLTKKKDNLLVLKIVQ